MVLAYHAFLLITGHSSILITGRNSKCSPELGLHAVFGIVDLFPVTFGLADAVNGCGTLRQTLHGCLDKALDRLQVRQQRRTQRHHESVAQTLQAHTNNSQQVNVVS